MRASPSSIQEYVGSSNFVTGPTEDDRHARLLMVSAEYTRECLTREVGCSFTAHDVMGVLQYLFAVRGTSETFCCGNGPEFVHKSKQLHCQPRSSHTTWCKYLGGSQTCPSNRRSLIGSLSDKISNVFDRSRSVNWPRTDDPTAKWCPVCTGPQLVCVVCGRVACLRRPIDVAGHRCIRFACCQHAF